MACPRRKLRKRQSSIGSSDLPHNTFKKRIAILCSIGYNPIIQYQLIAKAVKVTVLQSVQRYSYLWTLFYYIWPCGAEFGTLKGVPSLSKSGLPGKNPGRPQSIEDTYRQKTAGKRDAIAVLLSIWPAF